MIVDFGVMMSSIPDKMPV